MGSLLISLGAGALIGLIYSLIRVQSPAPPAVALVGLLGMVIGSTLGEKLLHNHSSAWLATDSQSQNPSPISLAIYQPTVKQAG